MELSNLLGLRTALRSRIAIVVMFAMLMSIVPISPAYAVAPTLNLSVTPDLVTQAQDVTITVESNQELSDMPWITLIKPNESTAAITATETAANTWTGVVHVEPDTPNGYYNVLVGGENLSSEEATATMSFEVDIPQGNSTIQGTVYNGTLAETSALAGCEVQLFDQQEHAPPIDNAVTEGVGNKFVFDGLAPGTYWVQARRPSNLPTIASSAMTQVVVAEDATATASLALRAPSLTGKVVDPDGNAVAGIRVDAHTKDYNEFAEDFTDSLGRFALTPVGSGTYVVTAYANGGSGYANSEGRVMMLGPVPQALSADEPLELREIKITGRIVNPSGTAGVPNIGVMIHTQNWAFQDNANTDSNGYFYFGEIPAGNYVIDAFTGPDSQFSQAPPTSVTITGGVQTLSNILLTYPSIKGTVSNPDPPGGAATGAFVQVRNDNFTFFFGAPTNDQGEYQIGGLPNGTYKIQAMPDKSSPYSNSVESTVTVNNSSATTKNLTLTVPMLIGKIVDGDGGAVRNANLALHTANWQTQYFSQPTGSNGRFAFGGIAAGTYQLELNSPFDRPELIRPEPLTIQVSAEGTYTVTSGDYDNVTLNGIPGIQVAFTKASKTIEGTVTKNGGAPVNNAQIFAFKERGSGFAWTTTNNSGEYSLGVSGGAWMVSVGPNKESTSSIDWAYTGQPKRVTFAENSATEDETVTFEVNSANAVVTGRILAPDGQTTVSNAHVELRNREGQGNGGGPEMNGQFSVNVPAGTYQLMVFFGPESPYGSPAPKTITAVDGQTLNVGDIVLKGKNSQIKGVVRDDSGQAISNAKVNAWQERGGFAQATTGSDGTFTINVAPGSWEIMLEPTDQASYVYSGPPIRVKVEDNQIKTGVNFVVTYADATIQGRVIDGDGNTMTDLYGFASASNEEGGFGGPLQGGRFEIKVPSGTYNVSGGFPPGTPYSLSSENDLEVGAGETVSVELTVVENNRTISGAILDEDGSPIDDDNLFIEVFAMNGTGSFQHAIAEQDEDGNWVYELEVADGQWRIGYFVEKGSGYLGRPPMDDESAITVNGDETYDITLHKASATVTGRVTGPDGNGLPYVFVFAEEPKEGDKTGRSRFFTDTMTDDQGYYTLGVPAGSYKIGAGMPPSKMKQQSLIYPELTEVTVANNDTETVNIQFATANSAIAGTVTFGGNAVEALVWAWSENGGYAEADAAANGTYSIPVKGNETWHVGARYEDENGFYVAEEQDVEVSDDTTSTVNLAVETATVEIPDAVTVTFAANEMKIIDLANGARLEIPAGALASSGNVTVMAQPKAGLRKQKESQPIGIGYEFTALNSDGQVISDFNSAVTVTFPYDPEDLPEGLSEEDLVPAYWDETSGTWKKVDSAVVDTTNHTIKVQITHFSLWGSIAKAASSTNDTGDDTGGGGGGGGGASTAKTPAAPVNLVATATSATNAVTITWNANSESNLVGYYLYRSLTDKVADVTKIATIAKGTNTYTDNDVTKETTYNYWLSAYDDTAAESDKTGPASATPGQVEVTFPDLPAAHWAKQFIAKLVAKGVITGYGDKTFRPSATVTRAEFAKMICLTEGWELINPATPSFSDIPASNWAYAYIETAKAHGAIGGYKDGTFKPGKNITRAEIAKILATTLGLTSGSSTLNDVDASWAKDFINACVKAGVVGGYKDGTFKPNASATRAEAAKMIYSILK